MTKIGNGNGLICGLHSKPHTVRPQNTLRSQWHFPYSFPKTDTNDKNREWKWPYMWFTEVSQVVQERAEGPKAPTALSGRVFKIRLKSDAFFP